MKQKVFDLSIQRLKFRRETIDVFAFINAKVKIYYDAQHVSLLFKVDDYVYLRCHHEYQLLDRFNKKISQQRYVLKNDRTKTQALTSRLRES